MDWNLPPQALNELFIQKADDADLRVKLAEAGTAFVRDKIKEMGAFRKIIPPQGVTVAECQQDLYSDTLYKVVHVQPGTYAMELSFVGEPDPKLIKGRRCAASFYTIASLKWEGNTEQLRTYPYAITDVIRDNTVKDVQAVEDRRWLIHCSAAVVARHEIANSGVSALTASRVRSGAVIEDSIVKSEFARESTTDDGAMWPVQRSDMTRLAKRFGAAGRGLKMTRALMTDCTYKDYNTQQLTDLGDKLTGEVAIKGFKYDEVEGIKIITTIKGNLLHDALIYGFTDPEYMGKFYILDNLKFFLEKRARQISFWGWENVGGVLVNGASVARCELISGDTTTLGTTYQVSTYPQDEESMGAENNMVADGYTWPTVELY